MKPSLKAKNQREPRTPESLAASFQGNARPPQPGEAREGVPGTNSDMEGWASLGRKHAHLAQAREG